MIIYVQRWKFLILPLCLCLFYNLPCRELDGRVGRGTQVKVVPPSAAEGGLSGIAVKETLLIRFHGGNFGIIQSAARRRHRRGHGNWGLWSYCQAALQALVNIPRDQESAPKPIMRTLGTVCEEGRPPVPAGLHAEQPQPTGQSGLPDPQSLLLDGVCQLLRHDRGRNQNPVCNLGAGHHGDLLHSRPADGDRCE